MPKLSNEQTIWFSALFNSLRPSRSATLLAPTVLQTRYEEDEIDCHMILLLAVLHCHLHHLVRGHMHLDASCGSGTESSKQGGRGRMCSDSTLTVVPENPIQC